MRLPQPRLKVLACALVATLILLAASPAVAEERRATSVDIPAGSVISGDLSLVAGRAVINGTVAGNLTAIAGYLDAVGPIGGGVTDTGGRLEIRGPVGGGVPMC